MLHLTTSPKPAFHNVSDVVSSVNTTLNTLPPLLRSLPTQEAKRAATPKHLLLP